MNEIDTHAKIVAEQQTKQLTSDEATETLYSASHTLSMFFVSYSQSC